MAGLIDATIVPAGAAAATARGNDDRIIETSIPARLDSLRWSGFHTRVVVALGITWILDGLEVTLAGALSGALKESPTLQFSNFDVGFSNSAYLAGAVAAPAGTTVASIRPAMPHCSSACRSQTPRKRERRDERPDCAAIAANPLDGTNEEMPGNVRFRGSRGVASTSLTIGHAQTTSRGRKSSRIAAKEPIAAAAVFG